MNEIKKPKKSILFYYAIGLAVIFILNLLIMPNVRERSIKEVDYGTFITMTEEKKIDEVVIESNRILFTEKNGESIYKTGIINVDLELVGRLHESGAKFKTEIIEEASPILSFIFNWILPIGIFFLLGQLLTRHMTKKMGGGDSMMFNLGKSNAKIYVKSSGGIKFDDVAGEDEAKENLTEIVDYLHNPKKYEEIGAKMPKGILLVGPPGTGKTMLAKAVAGEANVPFFSMSGSEFVEMFVGMGASKVRDLFKQARKKPPVSYS